MRERIQKLLSRQGVASRREAENLIKQGRVRVNGQVAILGSVITHKDLIELDRLENYLKRISSRIKSAPTVLQRSFTFFK